MTLEPKYILSFYDIPELFVSTDADNIFYISLFVDDIKGHARYLTREILLIDLIKLLEKKLTIMDVFNKNKNCLWFYLDSLNDDDFKITKIMIKQTIPEKYFPEKNYIGNLDTKEIREKIISSFEIKEIDVKAYENNYSNWSGFPKIIMRKNESLSFSFTSRRNIEDEDSTFIKVISNSVIKVLDTINSCNIDWNQDVAEYSYVLSKQKTLKSLI